MKFSMKVSVKIFYEIFMLAKFHEILHHKYRTFPDYRRMNEETRLDDFEMKWPRKILRVSWTAKKTNKWVLDKAGVKRKLLDTVKALVTIFSSCILIVCFIYKLRFQYVFKNIPMLQIRLLCVNKTSYILTCLLTYTTRKQGSCLEKEIMLGTMLYIHLYSPKRQRRKMTQKQ